VGIKFNNNRSNFESLISSTPFMSDGPIWHCTNLENSFALGYIINRENDQETCVFVDESLQLNQISCNHSSSTANVKNFICQRSIKFELYIP
jgi:hypothetical protein